MADLFSSEPDMLPVISLWQPWASLCFLTDAAFRKGHETRKFRYPAKYDGRRIGLQSAAAFPPQRFISDELDALCVRAFGADYRRTLPRGMLLGTVVLGKCTPSEYLAAHVGHADRVAGDWRPNRYGWQLDDPIALPEPRPLKAKQGWMLVPMSVLS